MAIPAPALSSTATPAPAPASPRRERLAGADRLRGVAVALMVADHLLIVTGYPDHEIRHTITRASMPLFFLLAGHLCRRLSVRQLDAAALGLVLPLLVPWIDAPNVLVWYALGCVWLRVWRGNNVGLAVTVAFVLTGLANGASWGVWPGSYNPLALVALMALGQLLPSSAFRVGERLPALFGRLGRYPLAIYAGHVLVLEAGRVSLGG